MSARPGPRSQRPRTEAHYGPERGTTYLIHFTKPFKHATHYRGWTRKEPLARFAEHLAGKGSVLTRAVARAGIGMTLARIWPGTTKDYEDCIKHQGGAARLCPECGVKPQGIRLPGEKPGQRDELTEADARERLSLYELERLGTTSDGTPLPVITTYPDQAIAKAAPGEENEMFGRERRAAAQRQAAQQAEADRLFAIADQLAAQAGERPGYQRTVTAERAARIREQLGEDLARDASSHAAPGAPELTDAERDAEVDRLAEMFPEPGSPSDWRNLEASEHPDPGRAAGEYPHLAEIANVREDYLPTTSEATRLDARNELRDAEKRLQSYREAEDGGPGWKDDAARWRRAPEPEDAWPEPGQAAQPAVPEMGQDYYTQPVGSDRRRAAYQEYADATGGPRDGWTAEQEYAADHWAELEYDRWQEAQESQEALQAPGSIPWEYGPDAAAWTPRTGDAFAAEDAEAGRQAPNHLYGAPECAEADPETAHFGAASPEAEDAGRFPLPRVLTADEAAPVRAEPAATLPDGTPNSDPFLAGRGWQARDGVYVRQPQAEMEAV